MRNRRKTIESLRRLAERPGTKAEGETAQRLLDQLSADMPIPKPFNISEWPRGTIVFYNYWCYTNERGVIVSREPKTIQGETWLRIKFDSLKQPRRVPVTSKKGCHLSTSPLPQDQVDYLWRTYSDD